MQFELKPWHLISLGVIVIIYVLTLTSVRPYMNNQLKPHRWRSSICKNAGVDPINCYIAIPPVQELVNGKPSGKILTTEIPQYDLCLEHGEWKRVR